jgi:hypothetical protein
MTIAVQPQKGYLAGGLEGTLDAFERTATELETRIGFLIEATRREEIQHA